MMLAASAALVAAMPAVAQTFSQTEDGGFRLDYDVNFAGRGMPDYVTQYQLPSINVPGFLTLNFTEKGGSDQFRFNYAYLLTPIDGPQQQYSAMVSAGDPSTATLTNQFIAQPADKPRDYIAGSYFELSAYGPQTSGFIGFVKFVPTSAVPEPATWGLMLLGFGMAGYALRRRKVSAHGSSPAL
ncbi:PEP-CTERM sorting domain-containing protein [Sphingomonas sp. MA1305]|nr:PEP-CTERM sorting domain-containing protein [Sphingomonas sp. MA1305]